MDEFLEVCFEEDEEPSKRIAHSRFVGKKRGPKVKSVPNELYPCHICTYSSARKHDLKRHYVKVHGPDSKCKLKEEEEEESVGMKDEKDDVIIGGKIKHSVIVKGRKRGPKMKNTYDKTFPCSLCTYISTRRFDLKRHVSVVHNKEKPYICDVCNFSAGLAETLKQHMLKVHNQHKFKCNACEFSCLNQTEYSKHLMSEHNYMPHTCNSCEFSCTTYLELKKHICREHKDIKPYKCNQCEYETCHKANLIKHTNYCHMKNVIFKCDVCSYTTNNGKYELAKHKRVKHKNKEKYRIIEDKGEEGNDVNNDPQTQSNKKIYECSLCAFTTTNGKYDLTRHKRLKHKIIGKQRKKNSKQSDATKDIEINELSDRLKVDPDHSIISSQSSFYYDHPFSANNHGINDTHLDDNHLIVNGQSSVTEQLSSVKKPTIEVIHTCDVCPFSTTTYESLNKHVVKVHTNNKIFVCSICQFESPRKYNFKHHLKLLHKKDDYELEDIAKCSLKTVTSYSNGCASSGSPCQVNTDNLPLNLQNLRDHFTVNSDNSFSSNDRGCEASNTANHVHSVTKINSMFNVAQGAHFLLGKPLLHNALTPPTSFEMSYHK